MKLRTDIRRGHAGYISGEEDFVISSDSDSQTSVTNSEQDLNVDADSSVTNQVVAGAGSDE